LRRVHLTGSGPDIQTVAATDVVREIGLLPSGRERELRRAIDVAFDLLPLGVA